MKFILPMVCFGVMFGGCATIQEATSGQIGGDSPPPNTNHI